MKKANNFYEIQDAVAFNNPIDDSNEFYTDFTGFRKGFNENKIYKFLNINPSSHNCNKLAEPKKLFLSGHRGTGITTELLKLKNKIDKTKCFLTILCDFSNEELDVNNIDFVDVIILILEKLIKTLQEKEIDIPKANIQSFYNWYQQRIIEINKETDESATIEIKAKAGFDIFSFLSLVSKTKGKLSGSNKTKETIRSTFVNKFSDFSLKFNQFILDIKEYLNTKDLYKDLLFIVDGFGKIGSLEDRRKILIKNSNKFIEIKTNMIITLPVELVSEASKINEFVKSISYPLISLNEDSIERFKKFIYKRVDKSLFKDEKVVEKIIEYGAGSPRETLRVLLEAFYEAEDDILDMQSVEHAQESMSDAIIKYLTKEELEVMQELNNNKIISYSNTLLNLISKKTVLDYGVENTKQINPIILQNKTFLKLLNIEKKKENIQKVDIHKEEISTLKEIIINKFFSINKQSLKNLSDKKEIYIVGENGDGKTLVLQAIALALKGVKEGRVVDFLKNEPNYNLEVLDNKNVKFNTSNKTPYRNLLAYGAHRNNNCKKENEVTGYLTLFDNSVDLKDPQQWLIDLYNAENAKEYNFMSVNDAKSILENLLNKDIELNITSNSVKFIEKNAPVKFEQLSAGYKGVITIIGDILVRLSENQPYVTKKEDFEGIVLIDEVELHLHPKWKYTFMHKLKTVFPNIQFIVTTHSPTVILGASKEAVFYKVYKKEGNVNISNQIRNKGYTNNSLISSPLFDLKTMASRDYDDKNFSDDDFIYEKIHQVVASKISEDIDMSEEEISKLISEELDKL